MSLCCACESYDEAKKKSCYHNPGCGLYEVREKDVNPFLCEINEEMAGQGKRCKNCD